MTRSLPRRKEREKKLKHIWSPGRTQTCCFTTRYDIQLCICSRLTCLSCRMGRTVSTTHSQAVYIDFEPHLSWFGHNITAFQHHVFPQLIWTSVGWLNHVFNVEKVKTIILCCKGVMDIPGLDEEVDCVQKLGLNTSVGKPTVLLKQVKQVQVQFLFLAHHAHRYPY